MANRESKSTRHWKDAIIHCPDGFTTTFGYTTTRVLGKGMMGQVMLAYNQSESDDKKFVALKTFKKTGNDAKKIYKMFKREVNVLQTLKHKHIMGNVMGFDCPEEYVMCMPYYKEGTLKCHLPTMTKQRSTLYLKQLASAVKFIHSCGLVHMDIKVDNVLISDEKNAILADFGLACLVKPKKKTEVLCRGTRGYMAPELENPNEKNVNLYKCDTYALGMVFWRMVFCGKPETNGMSYLEYLEQLDDQIMPARHREALQHLLDQDFNKRWDSNQLVSTLSTWPSNDDLVDSNRSN